MTIIAGFRCVDGVVVCGDSQETWGTHKKNVTKVVVTPEWSDAASSISSANLMGAFCGAGDGAFVDVVIRNAWKSAEHATDLEQACDYVEANIKDTYREYGEIYQQGECPSVSLIYGIKMDGDCRLFSAHGPIVNPVNTYTTNGIGHYMAEFLATRMYNGALTVHQCAILAAYILFQASQHVDGCGGESQIAVLRNYLPSGKMGQHRVDGITKILSVVDARLGEILLASGNLSDDYEVIAEMSLNSISETIMAVRKEVQSEVGNADSVAQIMESTFGRKMQSPDDLGFRPSNPQTSKDQ